MIGRTLLPGILFALAIWASAQAFAFEGEFLSSKKLQDAYRQFCPANIGELKNLPGEINVQSTSKNQGTYMAIMEMYDSWLGCDYQTDPIYKHFEDPVWIRETEAEIGKLGKEKYIDVRVADISETKERYKIERILDRAISNSGLSLEELLVLVVFEVSKAETQAIISALKSQ